MQEEQRETQIENEIRGNLWVSQLGSLVLGFKKIFVCFYFMYFPACICVYHIHAWGTQRPEEGARSSGYNVGNWVPESYSTV